MSSHMAAVSCFDGLLALFKHRPAAQGALGASRGHATVAVMI